MKSKRIFVCVLVALVIVSCAGTASASYGKKMAELHYRDIKITLNGEKIEPKDAAGNPVEPFIIDGTTYLPVRAIAEALGMDVQWDGETRTAMLSEPGHTASTESEKVNYAGTKHLLEKGGVFQKGSYILFEGVEILYNGETFEITNNRADLVRIGAAVVGVKADGTYEWILSPGFAGVDEYQYEKDLAENGWAIEKYVNLVRPGETLNATMQIFDFSSVIDGAPAADIDNDGYYDLVFSVYPQKSEDSFSFSTNDPTSDVYKLKAE